MICAAGADFFESFCVVHMNFSQGKFGQPRSYGGGGVGGGGSASSLQTAGRLDPPPPGLVKKGPDIDPGCPVVMMVVVSACIPPSPLRPALRQ